MTLKDVYNLIIYVPMIIHLVSLQATVGTGDQAVYDEEVLQQPVTVKAQVEQDGSSMALIEGEMPPSGDGDKRSTFPTEVTALSKLE